MADGKKKSKKGTVTMNLTEFLGADNVGNWGDDIELPTGPQSESRGGYDRDNYGGNRFGNDRYGNNDRYGGNDRYNNNDRYGNNRSYGNNDRYGNDDRYGSHGGRYNNSREGGFGGDQRRSYQSDRYGGGMRNEGGYGNRFENREPREPREPREQRPPRPIPENPPYTAYVGGLPEDTQEDTLRLIIEPLKIKSIRIMTKDDGKIKGFGYVEFEEREELEEFLGKSGILYNGRSLRIDVADQKVEKERPSDASNWRVRTEAPKDSGMKGGFSSHRAGSNDRYQFKSNQVENNWRKRDESGPAPSRRPFGNHRADEPAHEPREAPAPAAPAKKKVNPFGDAKPVNTAEIERKVEEKIKADEEILKKEVDEKKKEIEQEETAVEEVNAAPAEAVVEQPPKERQERPERQERQERPVSQQRSRGSYYNNNNNRRDDRFNNRSQPSPIEKSSSWRRTGDAPAFKSTGVFQRNNNQRKYQQPRGNPRRKEEEDNSVEVKNAFEVLENDE